MGASTTEPQPRTEAGQSFSSQMIRSRSPAGSAKRREKKHARRQNLLKLGRDALANQAGACTSVTPPTPQPQDNPPAANTPADPGEDRTATRSRYMERFTRIVAGVKLGFDRAHLGVTHQTMDFLVAQAIKSGYRKIGSILKDINLGRNQQKRAHRLKEKRKKRREKYDSKHNKRIPKAHQHSLATAHSTGKKTRKADHAAFKKFGSAKGKVDQKTPPATSKTSIATSSEPRQGESPGHSPCHAPSSTATGIEAQLPPSSRPGPTHPHPAPFHPGPTSVKRKSPPDESAGPAPQQRRIINLKHVKASGGGGRSNSGSKIVLDSQAAKRQDQHLPGSQRGKCLFFTKGYCREGKQCKWEH